MEESLNRMAVKFDRRELLIIAGYLGAGLLIAGLVRYAIQEVMGTFNTALLIAGGVLLLVSVGANYRSIRTASGKRSTKLGANTTAMSVAVIAILTVINFLSYKHHSRIDLTTEKLYSLSDQTRKIVSGLQKDIKVMKFDTSFGQPDDEALSNLMKEYRDLSSRITYEELDPQAHPEHEPIRKQYNVTTPGEVVVASDTRSEHVQGTEEQNLTNAILKVTRDTSKMICFVEGHGEKNLTSAEEDAYGSIDKKLKQENYETRSVKLLSESGVASDCAVLVVAGPKQPLFPQEVAAIGKYLESGGSVFLLIDPQTDTKLEDVLGAWGIELGQGIVVDPEAYLSIGGPGMPALDDYGSHQITAPLTKRLTFFPLARSLKVQRDHGTDATITELMKTSGTSWAQVDLKTDQRVSFDAGKDEKGLLTIGVAGTRKAGEKQSRLVVLGDSDFASNAFAGLAPDNQNLFMNAVNWLAQDEDLIAIRPKSATERTVTMKENQMNLLKWISLLFLPGAVVGSGIWIWWKRR